MKRRFGTGMAVAAVVLLSGCFHQVVATGLPAGTAKVDRPWTSTWIFGLVEAKPIDVRQLCSSGVAFVESKFTVGNWFGSLITLGIWTPRNVSVTCASGGSASLDPSMRTMPLGSTAMSLADAARLSIQSHAVVALTWDPSTPTSEATR